MRGAHLPGLLRSLVACGWFGIQTWVGGLAISALVAAMWPAWKDLGGGARFMGHGVPEYIGFVVFWLMNLYFVWAGTDSHQVAGGGVGTVRDLHRDSAPVVGDAGSRRSGSRARRHRPAGRNVVGRRRRRSSSPCSCRGSPRWWATGPPSPSTSRTSLASRATRESRRSVRRWASSPPCLSSLSSASRSPGRRW